MNKTVNEDNRGENSGYKVGEGDQQNRLKCETHTARDEDKSCASETTAMTSFGAQQRGNSTKTMGGRGREKKEPGVGTVISLLQLRRVR